MKEWGNPKKLPGGYSLNATCGDTTCYLPIPLRCLKSVEMSGHTGVAGEVTVRGIEPCCCGICGLCGVSSNKMSCMEVFSWLRGREKNRVHTALSNQNSRTFQGLKISLTFTLKTRQQTLMRGVTFGKIVKQCCDAYFVFFIHTVLLLINMKNTFLDWFKQFWVMHCLEIQGLFKVLCKFRIFSRLCEPW